MIDRNILKQIGFRKLKESAGYEDETWYHDDTNYFVYYKDEKSSIHIDEPISTMEEFIVDFTKSLISEYEDRIAEIQAGEDW